MLETTTTTNATKPALTIAVAIDLKSAIILGVAIFVAAVGALMIYRSTKP